VTVADEVDPLDARRPVGDAGAGEEGVNRAAALVDGGINGRLLRKVQADGLDASELDLCVVHHDDIGSGSQRQPGRRGPNAGGAAEDQDALAVESECIEERHRKISPWSGDDAARL
jgi:hypothetical protein